MAAREARAAGVAYVVSPRGMLVPELLRGHGRLRKALWIGVFERRTLAGAGAIVATSSREADDLRRAALALAPIEIVPNGLFPDDGDGDAAGDAAGLPATTARTVLFIGRLSWKKGLDRLLAAIADVPDTRLVVVGNDDEGLRPALERQARDLGLHDRIVFTGELRGAAKRRLLGSAQLFVLPSRSENFGNAVLEAMAAGVPVIVTPEVGLADAVREAGAGRVVPGEPPALAAAIRELVADGPEAREMGRRGRELARRCFSWESVATKMDAAYARVTRPRGREDLPT